MSFFLKNKIKLKQQKSIVNYISSSMIAIPVSLITSFISLRSVDVILMGTWTAVSIFHGYANFLGLGIVNGMNRELPHALGKNDKVAAQNYASSAMFYTLILVLVYLLLGLGYVVFFVDSYILLISVMAMVSKLAITTFSQYLEGTFRSNAEFDKLSKAIWISSVSRLLTAPLILFGYEGFLFYMILFDLTKATFLFIWRPIRTNPVYNKSVLISLMKVGIPIFIVTYLGSLIDTIPRLFILDGGGEIALGIFAPVMMLFGVFEQFQAALSSYIYPKLTYRFGQGEKLITLFKLNLKIMAGVSGLITVMVIPMYFALDYFVVLFPNYEASLPYLHLGLFAAPVITYNLPGVIFVIAKKFGPLYIIQVMKASFNIGIIYFIFNFTNCDIIMSSITGIISSYLFLGIISLILGWNTAINYRDINYIS